MSILGNMKALSDLERRVQYWLEKHGGDDSDWETAMNAVLKARPELKKVESQYRESWLSAQVAAALYEQLHQIKGVEIFKAGKWNKDSYDVSDLDEMIAAFPLVGYKPPLTLGHVKAVGQRAWGWVGKIYRRGQTLLADFVDVPDRLFQILKERGFDHVSSEIFWDVERGGRKFKRALKAVALLGADTPAVTGLAPISSSLMESHASHEARHHSLLLNYSSMQFDDTNDDDDEQEVQEEVMSTKDPQPDIDKLAKEHMIAMGSKDYGSAVRHILRTHRDLGERYAEYTSNSARVYSTAK